MGQDLDIVGLPTLYVNHLDVKIDSDTSLSSLYLHVTVTVLNASTATDAYVSR